MTVTAMLPNGQFRTATYRNGQNNIGFVRVNGVTVSGRIRWSGADLRYLFEPVGSNASLVK